MKKIIGILWLFLVTLALLTACAGPPSSELAAARDAVDEVVSEGADLFTPDDALALNNKLGAALAEIYEQDSRAIQNYALAKFILDQVVADADLLKDKLTRRKEELKASAEAALSRARAAIGEVRRLLENAPQGQRFPADHNNIQNDIDRLEVEITGVRPQIDASEYAVATEMASEVTSRALALYNNMDRTQGRLAVLSSKAGVSQD